MLTETVDVGLDNRGTLATLTRAAQYVRMSTEHQKYSTQNQAEIIQKYADGKGYRIVRTYADEGKSGLSLDGRASLQKLISDVQEHLADFSAILVYDVSRWGRFQDADESAYYEYICRRAGIRVLYCAEQFENDGSPVSTIVKGVKRAMAGEYSRELSVKVFTGQCHLIELGYRQGGPPGYGLRRMLIDQGGEQKGVLTRGEHKSIQTDRIILVPGPEEEVETVRWMYHAFVQEGRSERDIAAALNLRGLRTDLDRPWNRGTVHQVLINEKYAGNNVWNRVSCKLKGRRIQNVPAMWVRADGAFEPLVAPELFAAAQDRIASRSDRLSNDEMLQLLRATFDDRGYLSGLIIDESERLPSSSAYRTRFGSLLRAYHMVGFRPDRDYDYVEINKILRQMHHQVVDDTSREIARVGGEIQRDPDTDLLSVNREFTASIVISRCRETWGGALRWHIRFDTSLSPDITVAVRMDELNRQPIDYYLLPRIDVSPPRLRLAQDNGLSFDAYRFDTLDHLYVMAMRSQLMEMA
ncbi:recombinase family protein [Ferrovibrio sp.]|uniref:recombinase family protein n=1 Tax=Ferrovibrio sp. TaxID=1917215 RepID=UPI0025C11F06|nr:recombinase family protein [Ferrovibrio sp.]